MLKILISIVVLAVLASPARAEEKYVSPPIAQDAEQSFFQDLSPSSSTVKVQSVIDPVTFMGEDKKVYRLTGLNSPDFKIEEGAQSPAQSLKKLIDGQELKIYQTKNQDHGRINRMDQQLVHAEIKESRIWVQGEILSQGNARVMTAPDNPELLSKMYEIEAKARDAKKGIWADPAYAVLTPETAVGKENTFQIIEGTIRSISLVRNMIYLNFGPDWKQDFTIAVPSNIRMQFARSGIDPQQLTRAKIRVRGWLQSYNGPYIELTDTHQMEILKSIAPMQAQLPLSSTGSATGMQTISSPKLPEIKKAAAPKVEAPETPTAESKTRAKANP